MQYCIQANHFSYLVIVAKSVAYILIAYSTFESLRRAQALIGNQLKGKEAIEADIERLNRYLSEVTVQDRFSGTKNREPRISRIKTNYRKRLEAWIWNEITALPGRGAILGSAFKLFFYGAIIPTLAFWGILLSAYPYGFNEFLFLQNSYSSYTLLHYVFIVFVQGVFLDFGDLLDFESSVHFGENSYWLLVAEVGIRSLLTFSVPSVIGYVILASRYPDLARQTQNLVDWLLEAKMKKWDERYKDDPNARLSHAIDHIVSFLAFRR